MATFSPASNMWTLRYDQFGGICWQNSATQELYYIPPGQPPTLPPRSLANGVRSNHPNNFPVAPSSTVHSPQNLGGPVHFNNNPALRVPETARVGAASFVGCPQPNPSPSMLTEDGNQCLPPWCLPNAPRRYYPNDPYSIPAVTARTQAPPLQQSQAGGTGVHFNNNSALKEPETAWLRPASIAEGMGPYPRPPMSRTEDATRGLPPTRSIDAPVPNLTPEPHLTATADDRPRLSLLQGKGEEGQFGTSSLNINEIARLRRKATAEDNDHHPCLPMARVGDTKHELTAKSLSNAPRSSISNDPPYTPDATRGVEASLIRGYGEREQFSNNSVLGVTETARLRPKAIAEDKKPHPPLRTAMLGDTKHGSSTKPLLNAPRSNISNDPPFTFDATVGAGASFISGTGEREQFGKKSGLGVPEATRLRPPPIAEDKAPYSSTPISRTEDAKHELPRKTLLDVSPPNLPFRPFPATSSKHRAKESLQRGGEGGGQLDTSALKVSETTRLRQKSFTEDKKANPSIPMTRVGEAKHPLSTKRLSNAPRSNVLNDPPFNSGPTVSAEASLTRGNGGRERFGNNSTLKVPAGVELRPESIGEDNKPFPSPIVSTAEDTRHEWLSNAPRRNNIQDPPCNTTASARAEASLISASGEGERFDNNSVLETPETAPVSVLGTNPRPSASMSRAEEAKQWSRKRNNRGNEYYFNIITGQSQSKKPDCLKKYTCRR